jgi:anaerobic selenocysteine-containing dehydrogenase
VVLEQFQTDTADLADYVLPATTQLEHWDILKPYGHTHLALNRPAIAPVGQSLPNSEIFRRLAGEMGYTEPCFAEGDEEMLRDLVERQTHARFQGITWERLLAEGFVRLNLPQPYAVFAEGGFPTPSGKCEFFSARMAQDGYDPLPEYTAPRWQGAGGESGQEAALRGELRAGAGQLVCISPPAHSYLNTSFGVVDRLRAREGEPRLQMHPHDAAARGIESGSVVRVCNGLGEVELKAEVTEDVIAGTVLAPGVWWAKHSPDGRNINQITPQDEADMGAGALFYDVLVTVSRV